MDFSIFLNFETFWGEFQPFYDWCYFHIFSQLASVGVTGIPSQGGYYFMPDFEVCRVSMSKRGILNGKQMCEAILKEHQVAVSQSQVN